jgi:hypothetical protein
MEEKSPLGVTPNKRTIFDIIWNPTQKDIHNNLLLILSHGPGIILPIFLNYVFQTRIWMYLYFACLFCVIIARIVMAIRFEFNKSVALEKNHKRLLDKNRKKFIRAVFIFMPIGYILTTSFLMYLGTLNKRHELSINGIMFIFLAPLPFCFYSLWSYYNSLRQDQTKSL